MFRMLIDLIKSGTSLNVVRNHLSKFFLSQECTVTSKMAGLPKTIHISTDSLDYIRSSSLELMANEINERKIAGACAELGVYRGRFARRINMVFPERKLYLFDTFEGFNERDCKTDKNNYFTNDFEDFSDTAVESVLAIMPHQKNCIVKKGWFPKSANGLENEIFVFVSLDADLFEPIYAGLKFFYPKLANGGAIFVHDYNNDRYKGAKQAVRKFCSEAGISYVCISDRYGTAIIVK